MMLGRCRRDEAVSSSTVRAHALAALLLTVLVLPAAASELSNPGGPGATSHPRPLIIGLACEGSASSLRELHDWDPRVPMTDSLEQCLDGHTKLRIIPRSVALKYDPETENLDVVLTISEADRGAINNLFTVGLMGGKRRDLILVDGKVVVSRHVASVFSGPALQSACDRMRMPERLPWF